MIVRMPERAGLKRKHSHLIWKWRSVNTYSTVRTVPTSTGRLGDPRLGSGAESLGESFTPCAGTLSEAPFDRGFTQNQDRERTVSITKYRYAMDEIE